MSNFVETQGVMSISLQSSLPVVAYANAKDQARHLHVIQHLADELCVSVPEILPIYENLLISMRSQAKIFDYLSVLVSKRVKQQIKEDAPS